MITSIIHVAITNRGGVPLYVPWTRWSSLPRGWSTQKCSSRFPPVQISVIYNVSFFRSQKQELAKSCACSEQRRFPWPVRTLALFLSEDSSSPPFGIFNVSLVLTLWYFGLLSRTHCCLCPGPHRRLTLFVLASSFWYFTAVPNDPGFRRMVSKNL